MLPCHALLPLPFYLRLRLLLRLLAIALLPLLRALRVLPLFALILLRDRRELGRRLPLVLLSGHDEAQPTRRHGRRLVVVALL